MYQSYGINFVFFRLITLKRVIIKCRKSKEARIKGKLTIYTFWIDQVKILITFIIQQILNNFQGRFKNREEVIYRKAE